MKRRNFITQSSLLGTAAALSPAGLVQAQSGKGPVRADLIIKSAHVYTMDGARPLAESVAVMDNRILAVGSDDELNSLAGPGTKVIDGAGTTVTPGFIDAHSHPDDANEVTGADVNLRSIAEIKDAMQRQGRKTSRAALHQANWPTWLSWLRTRTIQTATKSRIFR
jgi:predicted amidohydrolase YtcJ